ncbi:MAG: thiamine phosphate synthase, partial [Candidatus Thermochlorobacter sp.]
KAAQEHGADFIIFGHIFETESKPALPPRGLAALKDVVQSVKIPVFAVGGITAANAKLCLEHGASGVAVISALATASDVVQRVQALLQALTQPVLRTEKAKN